MTLRFPTVLRWGVWFALTAGFVEALAVMYAGRRIMGFIYVTPHVLWMAPVANLLWFALPALVLALLARGGRASPGAVIAVFGSLAALCGTFLFSRLHPAAALLLALGLGIQGARLVNRRLALFDRVVRFSTPVLVLALLVAAAGVFGVRARAEQKRLAGLGAASGERPNVVLIILDTVRRASLSLHGYDRPTTPRLDQWAERGVVFDHAFATASWTLPSHASAFTGRWPHEMSTSWLRRLDDRWPTLAEWLGRHGYLTAGFVSNLIYTSADFGLARGFVHYEDYPVSFGEMVVTSSLGRKLTGFNRVRALLGYHDILGRKDARRITDDFLAWEAGRDRARPFFAFLNYFDAHQPFLPPPEFDREFATDTPRRYDVLEHRPHVGKVKDGRLNLSDAEVRREQDAYDAAIAYLDQQVSRLLESLERDGTLDNTIVIVTSDHGEQFMEHGLFGHGNSLYRYATEVPLLVAYPRGMARGLRVSQPVSIRDIPATVAALTGTADSAPFPGRNLAAVSDLNDAADAPPVLAEITLAGTSDTFSSIVVGRYRGIWMHDSTRLFDFETDPGEVHDLAVAPDGPTRLAVLRAMLDSIRAGPPATLRPHP